MSQTSFPSPLGWLLEVGSAIAAEKPVATATKTKTQLGF